MKPDDAGDRSGARARRLLWLPSLLTGMALAAALATAAGVLLYNAPGLARAATVLIVASGVALAVGVKVGAGAEDQVVTGMGRGWRGLLGALAAGAAFAVAWEFTDGNKAVSLAQGLGLAAMAVLPAYYAGGVWGRMSHFAASLGPVEPLRVLQGGAVGIAIGAFLMVGLLGQPVLAATVILGALVLASAGARIQGWIFDRVPVCAVAREVASRPELRFEMWRTSVPERRLRLLWDGGSDRAVDPAPPGDWRRAVAATLEPSARVLFVGAGSWFSTGGDREWRLTEPDRALLDLAAGGFQWDSAQLVPWDAAQLVPSEPAQPVPWDAASLADSEVADRWTIVVDRDAAPELWPRLLALPGATRIWLGGHSGQPLAGLAEAAQDAGFAAVRYLGTRPRSGGPPMLAVRRQELWRFERPGADTGESLDFPAALPGMKAVTAED